MAGSQISITTLIIIANVAISLMAFSNVDLKSKLIFSPYAVKHQKQYLRVFSHAFIHADYTHLIFNMIALYFLGEVVENDLVWYYGNKGYVYYLLLYFAAIPASSLPSMFKHGDDPNYLSLGASGAVTAIVFAAIILAPMMELRLFLIPIPIKGFIFGIMYLIFETYASKKGMLNIAHDAHIAGAIFGLLFILFLDFHFYLNFFQQVSRWIQSIF